MQDNDSFSCFKRSIHQPSGVLRIAEGGIEYHLRVFGAGRYRQRRALARGVSACREDDAIPAFGRCPGKCPLEQFVANPGGRRMHGFAVFRAVLVIFVKQSGRVIGVQYIAEARLVLSEVVFRIFAQLAKGFLLNVEFVLQGAHLGAA